MKLTEQDKALLREWGEQEEDFAQIEETMNGCEYDLNDGDNVLKKISRAKAIELLGRKDFLSGIVRCAFHMTASRETSGGQYVGFNNGKLWRKWFK